jgi:hypothetical protein
MKKIRFIHWNAGEFRQRAQVLQNLGYEVMPDIPSPPELMRALRQMPTDIFVIDLSRLPSQGRDIGISIRSFKNTCSIPLVFVGGLAEKVAPIEKLLPDAFYTSWDHIEQTLHECEKPVNKSPVRTKSAFDGYAGKSLTTKLGIKPGHVIALFRAPEGFTDKLSPLPHNVTIHDQLREGCDLIVWFARSCTELSRDIRHIGDVLKNGSLWIAWPKKGTQVDTDLTQVIVRKQGLATGLVDFKICSIDETWSGLLFRWRKKR